MKILLILFIFTINMCKYKEVDVYSPECLELSQKIKTGKLLEFLVDRSWSAGGTISYTFNLNSKVVQHDIGSCTETHRLNESGTTIIDTKIICDKPTDYTLELISKPNIVIWKDKTIENKFKEMSCFTYSGRISIYFDGTGFESQMKSISKSEESSATFKMKLD